MSLCFLFQPCSLGPQISFHLLTCPFWAQASENEKRGQLGQRQHRVRHLAVICQYASYVPLHSPSFPSPLRPSRHASVLPITSPSPSSLCFTYSSLSSSIVSPSFVFRLFLRYGSIPPLLCSEHHSSDLWLRYHSLTSSHSCGWTISLLSS